MALSALNNLSGTQKLVGIAAGGVGLLYLLSRKGAGSSGTDAIAVVDVRRPTDDINAIEGSMGGYTNSVTLGENSRYGVYYDDVFQYTDPNAGAVNPPPAPVRPPTPVVPTRPRPGNTPKPPSGPITKPPPKAPVLGKYPVRIVAKAGDTAASIAGKYYGDPARARLITQYNDALPNDPSARIQPGTPVVIPRMRKK